MIDPFKMTQLFPFTLTMTFSEKDNFLSNIYIEIMLQRLLHNKKNIPTNALNSPTKVFSNQYIS